MLLLLQQRAETETVAAEVLAQVAQAQAASPAEREPPGREETEAVGVLVGKTTALAEAVAAQQITAVAEVGTTEVAAAQAERQALLGHLLRALVAEEAGDIRA